MLRHHIEESSSPAFDDSILKEMYVECNTPCDRLVSDLANLLSFTEQYTERTGQQIGPAHIAHRLLTLRKLGQAKGGLPRLRRVYHGRD